MAKNDTETQKALIKIKQRLIENHLSFVDLSKRSGVTNAAISKGMNGKTKVMKPSTLELLETTTDLLIKENKEA